MSDRTGKKPKERPQAPTGWGKTAIVIAFGISGAAALIYEVAWTRELSLVFSSTVYAVSMMLAAFMSGLALGGYLGGRRADGDHDHLRDFAVVELGIGVFGFASLLLIRALPFVQFELFRSLNPPPAAFFGLQLVMSFLVMLVPTALMGATFPLVSKLSVDSLGGVGRTIGNLYSANNFGAIIGSLAGGFALIPFIGVSGTVVTAACINVAVAILLLVANKRRPSALVMSTLIILFLLIDVSIVVKQPPMTLSFGIMNRYKSYDEYRRAAASKKVLWSTENEYSRTVVYEDAASKQRSLINGSLIEGADSLGDRVTTNLLSLLPAAYGKADSVLVVGLGTSLTSQAALSLPVKHVTTVEINPAMRTAMRYFGGSAVERDPRWKLVTTDARHYLQMDPGSFDLITSEPSWPLSCAVSPLFTREFFALAKSRLTDDGVFCQWIPWYLIKDQDLTMMHRTFESEFPGSKVWIFSVDGSSNGDVFFIGSRNGRYVADEVIRDSVQSQLSARGMGVGELIPFPYPRVLASNDTKGGPMNTDDRPLLEFRAPWSLATMMREMKPQ